MRLNTIVGTLQSERCNGCHHWNDSYTDTDTHQLIKSTWIGEPTLAISTSDGHTLKLQTAFPALSKHGLIERSSRLHSASIPNTMLTLPLDAGQTCTLLLNGDKLVRWQYRRELHIYIYIYLFINIYIFFCFLFLSKNIGMRQRASCVTTV